MMFLHLDELERLRSEQACLYCLDPLLQVFSDIIYVVDLVILDHYDAFLELFEHLKIILLQLVLFLHQLEFGVDLLVHVDVYLAELSYDVEEVSVVRKSCRVLH